MAGEHNPKWKGGITPRNQKIRASDEYKTWRSSVFNRDNFTCVQCGQRGGPLNADHIMPFSTHPDLRFEVSNGRTLCVPCHRKTPTFLAGALRGTKQPKRAAGAIAFVARSVQDVLDALAGKV